MLIRMKNDPGSLTLNFQILLLTTVDGPRTNVQYEYIKFLNNKKV